MGSAACLLSLVLLVFLAAQPAACEKISRSVTARSTPDTAYADPSKVRTAIIVGVLLWLALSALLALAAWICLRRFPERRKIFTAADVIVKRVDVVEGELKHFKQRKSVLGSLASVQIALGGAVLISIVSVQFALDNASISSGQDLGSRAPSARAVAPSYAVVASFAKLQLVPNVTNYCERPGSPGVCANTTSIRASAPISEQRPVTSTECYAISPTECQITWRCTSACSLEFSLEISLATPKLSGAGEAGVDIFVAPVGSAFDAVDTAGSASFSLAPDQNTTFFDNRYDFDAKALLIQRVLDNKKLGTTKVGYGFIDPVVSISTSSFGAVRGEGAVQISVQVSSSKLHAFKRIEARVSPIGFISSLGGIVSLVVGVGALVLKGIEFGLTRVAMIMRKRQAAAGASSSVTSGSMVCGSSSVSTSAETSQDGTTSSTTASKSSSKQTATTESDLFD